MKTLQRLCIIIVLCVVLGAPVSAGDIQTGIAPPPPSAPMQAAKTDTTTWASETAETEQSVLIHELQLGLLQTLLVVF